jgi:hypothetical protein
MLHIRGYPFGYQLTGGKRSLF